MLCFAIEGNKSDSFIKDVELKQALARSLEGKELKKVLILPPDYTRMYSGAGKITAMYYDIISKYAEVDIMPTLGTHEPMTKGEWEAFFGEGVPFERMIVHNWRRDVVKIGEKVPAVLGCPIGRTGVCYGVPEVLDGDAGDVAIMQGF